MKIPKTISKHAPLIGVVAIIIVGGVVYFSQASTSVQEISDTTITHFDKQPVSKQLACADQDKPSMTGDCGLRDISQEELLAFAYKLNNAKVGQQLSLPKGPPNNYTGNEGKVISLGNHKALLVLAADTQAVGSTVSVYWFDSSFNLYRKYQTLAPSDLNEAVKTTEYQNFMASLSSFKP